MSTYHGEGGNEENHELSHSGVVYADKERMLSREGRRGNAAGVAEATYLWAQRRSEEYFGAWGLHLLSRRPSLRAQVTCTGLQNNIMKVHHKLSLIRP